jgi:imidazoleglycerol phosphate dehydratase HisB
LHARKDVGLSAAAANTKRIQARNDRSGGDQHARKDVGITCEGASTAGKGGARCAARCGHKLNPMDAAEEAGEVR